MKSNMCKVSPVVVTEFACSDIPSAKGYKLVADHSTAWVALFDKTSNKYELRGPGFSGGMRTLSDVSKHAVAGYFSTIDSMAIYILKYLNKI